MCQLLKELKLLKMGNIKFNYRLKNAINIRELHLRKLSFDSASLREEHDQLWTSCI